MSAPISRITLYHLTIPMKVRFAHAAGQRAFAEPIVFEAELANGTVGYGETHPRDYVTGETIESVYQTVEHHLVPLVLRWRPDSFPAALELLSELPFADTAGRCIAAARAGLELALLDAYSRLFRRSIDEAAGWLGLANFGPPGSVGRVRYSGILSGGTVSGVLRSLRRQRLFGLRHFKLKVGLPDDQQVLPAVVKALGGKLRSGRASLRLDANGAWSPEQAAENLTRWRDLPIACVEQPLRHEQPEQLAKLRARVDCPLMADESLVTYQQAQELAAHQAVDFFNIRLSKNGGLLPAIKLAGLARQSGIAYQLGCMVGETGILSAAGRRFLQVVPAVRFAEGSFGRFLLTKDVVSRPVRFGYGGRFKALGGLGWGIDVQPKALRQLTDQRPTNFRL